MNHLDLFSGIGGFALAARWVWGKDHKIISFVEIEGFPQKVLKKNFPGVPIHDDIKTFDGTEYRGTVDLLTGGFPCQPYSVAGKQKGAEDDRNLWPDMFRVIQEARPTWVIGENVANIVNFVEFENLLIDLESAGYEVQPLIIPAAGVDAPHRRDRVWILAYSINHTNRTDRGSQRKAGGLQGINRQKRYAGLPCGTSEDVVNATDKGLAERETGKQFQPIQDVKRRSFDVSDNEGKRSQRFREGWKQKPKKDERQKISMCNGGNRTIWQPEPDVCRVANGIPNRVDRLKGLGNAIVPQVVYEIMRAIKHIDDNYKQAI